MILSFKLHKYIHSRGVYEVVIRWTKFVVAAEGLLLEGRPRLQSKKDLNKIGAVCKWFISHAAVCKWFISEPDIFDAIFTIQNALKYIDTKAKQSFLFTFTNNESQKTTKKFSKHKHTTKLLNAFTPWTQLNTIKC